MRELAATELLKEALPHMTRAACLLNPDNPGSIGLTLALLAHDKFAGVLWPIR